jgi:hypothetical protein
VCCLGITYEHDWSLAKVHSVRVAVGPHERQALKGATLRPSQRRGDFFARAILASARKYAVMVSGTAWL